MSFFNLFDLGIALLYFLGALLYVGGLLGNNAQLKKVSLIFTMLGFVMHSGDLALKLIMTSEFSFTQGKFYFSFLAWTFLLIYLLLWIRLKLQFLALTAAPLALIIFSSSMVMNTAELAIPAQLSYLWFGLHVTTLFLSIALLAMASGAGICYLFVDKQLKNKTKPGKLRKGFPSLSSFDRVNHWAVSLGFPLFTIGTLSGFLWARFTWGQIFTWDPKEILTIITWFLFAYLFHQRLAMGWKGKKPARLATWLFVLSLVSLLVINFYFPTHHSFQS
jgi:cytochrome c-type biogenesis protein CcsB